MSDATAVTRAEPSATAEPPAPARTVLNPAARLLWRSERSVQLELGAARVVLDGVDSRTVRRLVAARGETDPDATVARLQAYLTRAGFLWPAAEDEEDLRLAPPAPRLSPELTALAARHGEHAAELLSARRHCTVTVHGSGRAGPHVAAVLAAAGVGRVQLLDRSAARLHHVVPGGTVLADEGVRLDEATATAVRRVAPEADTTPPPLGERPDLVLLAADAPIDPDRRDGLHARGCAHLLVGVGPSRGVVGPLVLPGLTSCLGCAERHRRDRDPAWSALAVQLAQPHRSGAAAEVALATTIAGIAAAQVLEFLDGGRPATIEASLEIAAGDWRLRRRTWPRHPACDCMRGP